MAEEKGKTGTERLCPFTYRVIDEDLIAYPCLKAECQCWTRNLDGFEHCGFINRK